MRGLRLLAANAAPFYRGLAAYLSERLQTPVAQLDDAPWGERLRLLDAGEADAAATDSIVLEHELRARPALAEQIRVVATLGPNPAPPLVAGAHMPVTLQARVRAVLLAMHGDAAGRALLHAARIARFAPVRNASGRARRRTDRVVVGVALVRQP